jgi:putative PIG3 family NAD(P)H quinone oxidoreductase
MRVEAIQFRGAGGVEVIALGETDVRLPGPGEVAVEIAAAGVNRADLLQRRGLYPPPPGVVADVPGLELAGHVVVRGEGAARWQVGDAVMAVVPGGAMARRIVVHERELIPIPAGLSLTDAAAIPEVFITAWDAFAQAGLRAGETVLIHAAASGVGTAALQLARAMGARALGTSRQSAKLAGLGRFGLAPGDGLAVTDGRFATGVMARSGHGADVILDCVGAAYFEENLRALAARGRMVMIGTLGGATGPAPVGMLLGKRATVIGTVMRARPLEEKLAVAQAAAARLVPMFARGLLTPVVDRVLPMRACAEAHAALERDETVGKIVLAW